MAVKMSYDKNTAIRIRDFLVKQGMTIEGAYGLMANIYAESGFRSNNAQNSYMTKLGMTDESYTTKVDNGEYKTFGSDRVGYGLCQWTSAGRKEGLVNYAKSCKVSIGNETMQLQYLMKELSTSYKAVLKVLTTSRSVEECAKCVMTQFERPADQSATAQNKRASYGVQLMTDLGGGTTTSSSITSSTTKNLYYVQCGAFSKKQNAEALKKKLESAGFNSIIKNIDGLFKIQVGVFSSRQNAEKMVTQLKNKGFNAAIIFDGNKTNTQTTTSNKPKFKVAVDAGHGSDSPGKRSPEGYREHYINVKCANYFDIAMKRCGIDTLKVAWDDTNAKDDTDVPLTTRQAQIKNAKCDISISFHANAAGNGKSYNDSQGVETLIHNNASYVGDSRNLANKVQSYLAKGTTQKNRGVKTQGLAMCNCDTMGTKAAILIEVGFMTNKYEEELMKTDAFCLECAEETAKGVCEYLGVKYVAK